MLAGVLAAAIFRSYDPLAVLACRMRIVPISLLGTAIVLLAESLPFSEKISSAVQEAGIMLLSFTGLPLPVLPPGITLKQAATSFRLIITFSGNPIIQKSGISE